MQRSLKSEILLALRARSAIVVVQLTLRTTTHGMGIIDNNLNLGHVFHLLNQKISVHSASTLAVVASLTAQESTFAAAAGADSVNTGYITLAQKQFDCSHVLLHNL